MRRRAFLELLAGAGYVAQWPSTASAGCCTPETASKITYEQIRALVSGKEIYLVPFSHTDWAWVNSRAWMIDRHALVLSDALDFLRTEPGFRFYIETWNEQLEAFLARRPDRIGEMRKAIAAGSIEVCGATSNQHPGWMETESLVRDLVLGRRLFRDFAPEVNLDVIVKPDVTPGSSQMPQILRKAGYRYYGINRPDPGMTAQGIPRQFIWRGLDGSEIITAREGGCGFIADDSLMDDFQSNWQAAVERLYQREISQHTDSHTVGAIWLPVGCDDSRPLRHWHAIQKGAQFEEPLLPLPAFIKEWNRREKAPMQWGTPLDVFRRIEKNRSALPLHEGIVDPTMWTYWYGLNGNKGLRLWRTRADRSLTSGEKFWSCAATLGETYPEQEYANFWRDLSRAYSHAQMWLFSADYDSQLQRVKTTLANANDVRDRALNALAGRVQFEDNRSCMLLFNEMPWERTEVVQIWSELQHPDATNVKVTGAHGQPLPFQVVDVNWYDRASGPKALRELKLLVEVRVPALGYTTVYIDPASGNLNVPADRSGPGEIDTPSATIAISEHGVDHVLDKRTGARFEGAGNVIFNETKDDPQSYHFGPVLKTFAMSGGHVESIIQGPLRSSFRVTGNIGPHRCVLEGHFYPRSGVLRFNTTIRSEPGSGHFIANVGLPGAGSFAADVHFGVEPRDLSKIAYGSGERLKKDVFYGAHWTDWSDGGRGVALIATTGEKGFEYSRERNSLGHFLLMTIPRDTTTWERFVTRAREGTGEHTFDYQLLFHKGDWNSGAVVRRTEDAQHPIVPVFPNWRRPAAERTLPAERSFAGIGTENVQLSAMYRDQGRNLIRVYESSGSPARASMELPAEARRVREVDFNGAERDREISVSGRRVEFEIRPWEIVTLDVA